jgi:hypothetical protein
MKEIAFPASEARLVTAVARRALVAGLWLGVLMVWSIVAVLLLLGTITFAPDCPTEDSCAIDYRNGEWHIEEVTP